MRGYWFVALVAGCGFKVNNTPIDGSMTDAVDAAGTMTCPWPYTPSGFDPCSGVPAETLPDLDLSAPGVYLYDTIDGTLAPPAGAPELMVPRTQSGGARVIWTKSFRIGAGSTLRVTGDDPLVVISQTTVTIDGTLDVGSHRLGNDRVGAGSNPASCATATLSGTQCTHGGSGGGGGGFGTAGGPGGVGGLTRDCGAGSQAGIAGGPGGAVSTDPGFRGGCSGGDGAEGDGSAAGAGGDGGGAVHVAARDTLRVGSTGQVLAGGGGGRGGNNGRSAGGGGGSGGLILLGGTSITVSGIVAANGGAGGGGSDGSQAGGGGDGQPSLVPATGGLPEGSSGTGGKGAVSGVAATGGTGVERGGGGGGGGVGKIRLTTKPGNAPVTTGSVITPAPI